METDNNRALIEFQLDTDELKASVEETKKLFESLYSDIEDIGQSIDRAAKRGLSFEDVAAKVSQAGDMIEQAWKMQEGLINANDAAIEQCKREYAELGKEAKNVYMSTEKGAAAELHNIQERQRAISNEISKRKQLNREIGDAGEKLAQEETRFEAVRNTINKTNTSNESLRMRLREVTMELQNMRAAAYESGGEAAVKAAMLTDKYKELAQQAAYLKDIQKDVNAEMATMSNDNQMVKGVIQGVSGIAGVFSVAQGAIGMFVGESAELQKVMVRVQSLMATMMGLQQIMNTINKDSALMTSLRNLKAAFTGAGTAAAGAAKGVKALWAALKANPIGLIVTAVTALISVIGIFRQRQKDMEEKAKAAREEVEKLRQSIAEMAASPVVAITKLQKQWNSLGDDMEAKRRFIEDNSDAFRSLGVGIQSVTDAENLLVNNTTAFVTAMRQRAMAAAAEKKAESIAAQLMDIQLLKQEKNIKETPSYEDYQKYVALYPEVITALEKEKELNREIDNIFNDILKYEQQAAKTLENAGIKTAEEVAEANRQMEELRRKTQEANRLKEQQIKAEIETMNAANRMLKEQEEAFAEAFNSARRQYLENLQQVMDANKTFSERMADLEREYQEDLVTIYNATEVDSKKRDDAEMERKRRYSRERISLIRSEVSRIEREVRDDYEIRLEYANMIEDEQERTNELLRIEREQLEQMAAAYQSLVADGKQEFVPYLELVNAKIANLGKTGKTTAETADKVADDIYNAINRNMSLVSSIFSEAAYSILQFAAALESAGKISEAQMGNIEEVLSVYENILSKTGTGAQVGGSVGGGWGALVGAIIGTVSGVIDEVVKSISAANAKFKETKQTIRDLKEEIKQLGEYSANIFGDTKGDYGRFLDNLNEIKKAERAILTYERLIEQARSEGASEKFLAGLEKKVEEAYKRMAELANENGDIMSSIFGNIGKDLLDAVTSPLDSIDSAFSQLTTNIEGYIREWVQQMFYADKIADKMKFWEYQMNVASVSGNREYIQSMLRYAIGDIMDYAKTLQAEWGAYEAIINDVVGDMSAGGSSRQGATKGIAQASQDSINELLGRATAIQGHTFNISENSSIIRDNVSTIMGAVMRIDRSTEQTEKKVSSIYSSIEDIKAQGIKIKK